MEAKEVIAILVFNMVVYCAAKVVILWKSGVFGVGNEKNLTAKVAMKALRTLRLCVLGSYLSVCELGHGSNGYYGLAQLKNP